MDSDAVISLRGIRNQFGRDVVHDDLDLDVWRGEVLGVVGGSGTGKSVLLRTIVGLRRPQAGASGCSASTRSRPTRRRASPSTGATA